MRVVVGEADRGPLVSTAIALAALSVLVLTVPLGLPTLEVSLLTAATVIAALAYRTLLSWPSLLAATFLVILFIPIKRYSLPGGLPFDLEPYRVLVMLIVTAWLSSLLIDPRVRLRGSGFEGPALLIAGSAAASIVVNGATEAETIKGLMFLGTFFVVFYLIVSVARTNEMLDRLVMTLVAGGAVVSVFALVESRTGYNVFEGLDRYVPMLATTDSPADLAAFDTRGGGLRVFGSAQHPIALGAALVVLLPFGVYIARRTGKKVWWLATAVLPLGALASLSRTSVLMLIPLVLVFIWLRPAVAKRLWLLAIPCLCVIYFALPGTIGTLRDAFFPAGGLIAEQQKNAGSGGSGRIADLGPALDQWAQNPVLGEGYGTRQTGREQRTSQILDNQWLKTLLETGIVGVFAWVWLFIRFARRLGHAAKEDHSDRGWLLVACTASVLAYAVGMFFYDAFSFVQVTFLLFVALALGAAAAALPEGGRPARAPRARSRIGRAVTS